MNNQTEPASDSMVEQFRKEADEAFAQSKLTDWHKVTFLIGYRMGRESLEKDNELLRLYIQRLTNQRDALADVTDPIQPPFESK